MLNKWEKENGKLICYFDIDGVLNDYPDSWTRFLTDERGDVIMEYVDIFNPLDLNTAKAQIPYQLYRDLKADYRSSGYKETIPCNDYASSILKAIKTLGYHIVIITSRPIKTHPELFKQTINWLDTNDLVYDNLMFDEDKHISVLSSYPHLKFGVEDNRYYANLIASWGYKMFLLDNDYNDGDTHENVQRIDCLNDILEYI
jgi:uncharacterized HAD superfamily protein